MKEGTAGIREQLLSLDCGDADVDAMKDRLERFNVFEAIGMTGQEIRHSNFLAFLLDPRASHGLRDAFAKGLLSSALRNGGEGSGLTTSDVEGLALIGLEVERERDNIDILLTDHANRLVAVIENKTWSGENGDQLERYEKIVEARYPEFRRLLLYLAPGGDGPSNERYLPVTYEDVDRLLRVLVGNPPPSANPAVLTLLREHYLPLLRREGLVSDKELAELAARVYRRHKSAIDYIMENEARLAPLEELVRGEGSLKVVGQTRSRIAFVGSDWKALGLESDTARFGWRLQFQFRDEDTGVNLVLRLEPAQDELGQRVVDAVEEAGAPFRLEQKRPGQNRVLLYNRPFLRRGDQDDEDGSATSERIRREWRHFLSEDLPRVQGLLHSFRGDRGTV